MRIKSIKIDGFKPFQFSNIENLFINFESPIHVILGTNGCGKSFLFNEMRFFPTLRANYESNGYKEIEVEHNNHTYTFGLDNSSSKKYYFFLEDGVELNQSGNESIQKELITKYLGYTSTIEEIIHCDKSFTNIAMSSRKEFLKEVNPCDLSLLASKKKLVSEAQTICKDRLRTLKATVSECESKLLPEEEFKSKEEEVKLLDSEFIRFTNELAVVNNEIFTIEKEYRNSREAFTKLLGTDEEILDLSDNELFLEFIQKVKNNKREIDEYFANLKVDISDIEHKRTDAERDCALYESKLNGLISQANSALEDIDKYKRHIEETEKQSSVSALEVKLKSIEEEINLLPNTENIPYIPENRYKYMEYVFNDIREDLETIHSYGIKKIFYPLVIKAIKIKINNVNLQLTNWKNEKFSKLEELNKVNNTLNNLPKGPSEELPVCNDCGYQLVYKTRKQELFEKKAKLENDIKYLENIYDRFYNAVGKLSVIFEQQNRVNDLINNVIEKLEETELRINSKTQFVDTLNHSVIGYIKYLDNILSLLPVVYKKEKRKKEYDDIKNQILSLKNSNIPAKSMLEELIKSKTKDHEEILRKIEECEKTLKVFRATRDCYSKYKSLESKNNGHRTTIEKYASYLDIVHKLFIRYQFREQLNLRINTISARITELRAILHNQNHYKVKYQESIEELKSRDHELKVIGELLSALSIETGYAQKIIVDYTNGIIKNVNYIINAIWTYPIKLQELSMDHKFDGKISVQIESVIVPDIKNLSKGQRAIVDFAFTIALMICSKLSNYPLFLDEITNGSFSELHKEKLLSWMRTIIDEKYASQLFVIDHDAYLNNGFRDATMICMKDDGSFNKDNAASKFIKYLQ